MTIEANKDVQPFSDRQVLKLKARIRAIFICTRKLRRGGVDGKFPFILIGKNREAFLR
jgi:hypothetical protein